jgi:hypothetical protein
MFEESMSKPNLIHIVKSVIAAMVGVQSDKNRQIDFQHGSLGAYVIVGIVVTVLFVLTIITVVKSVIGN